MRRILRAALAAAGIAVLAVAGGAAQVVAADKAMIVLDASGSMWAEIGGKTKIEIARETLDRVLGEAPADLELGLIAYGHREKGSCDDIEEIVAAGPGTRASIAEAARRLNPKGKTPITQAVRAAAEALRFTEDKATVILVTDGIETCNADPCAAARELEAQGIDFTTHVVGFGLSKDEGRQVACIAEATGGKYFEASDAAGLAAALAVTFTLPQAEAPKEEAPEPQVAALEKNVRLYSFLAEGVAVEGRDVRWEFRTPGADSAAFVHYGAAIEVAVEPGVYRVTAAVDLASAEFDLDVSATELAERNIVLGAAAVDISVRTDAGSEPSPDAFYSAKAGGQEFSGYGPTRLILPAGEAEFEGKIGSASVTERLSLAAGETRDVALVVGAGILEVKAVYAEGGPEVEANDLFVEVFEAKKSLDGSRKSVANTYAAAPEFPVAAGDYVVAIRLSEANAEAPATVKAGERSSVVVNLNAGVLAVAAPGAYWIEVFSAKKDLQGNRKSIAGVYAAELQITVAPGDYVVEATIGSDSTGPKKSAPATVKAAERTEIEIR
jgi:Ca-activated chloride channel family protein